METLRIVKAIMVATVGGWACLIAYDNIVDYWLPLIPDHDIQ